MKEWQLLTTEEKLERTRKIIVDYPDGHVDKAGIQKQIDDLKSEVENDVPEKEKAQKD